jgi:hypothetical protein
MAWSRKLRVAGAKCALGGALALTMSLPHALHAQAATSPSSEVLPAYRYRVLGVYDARTGDPIEAVDVSDVTSGVTARTTSTGTVSLAFLPEGGGIVRIRKVGYEMQTLLVAISSADTLPLTLLLKAAVQLPTVRVVDSAPVYRSPALRGFEERRRNAASGQFIPDSLIRKEEGRHIGSFLRAYLSNAQVVDGRGGSVHLLRSLRCARGEAPAVYLDGTLLGPPVNLAELPLTILAGIEYYATTGTAPSQFNATLKSCGALLLWTREK